jgi:hypothetical protein
MAEIANDKELLIALKAGLEKELITAVEPLVQQALVDIEKALRERLAVAVMTRLDRGYQVSRSNEVLTINVNLGKLID